jgi:hypothetical protein
MKNKKRASRNKTVSSAKELQARHPINFALLVLIRLTKPRVLMFIAAVILVLLCPYNDRVDLLKALLTNKLIYIIIILILVFTVTIMGVCWYFTRREDKQEIKRLAGERDKLQEKLGCAIHSSTE